MRNTWKILNMLNSFLRCSKKSPCRKFSNNGIGITDPKQIANGFNQYFANIGLHLHQVLDTPVMISIIIFKMNEEEIVKVI